MPQTVALFGAFLLLIRSIRIGMMVAHPTAHRCGGSPESCHFGHWRSAA
jgi:hypothetical protein